jgi:hypothetical protein
MTRRWLAQFLIPWLLGGVAVAGPVPQKPGAAARSDEAAVRSLIAAYAKSIDAADTTVASTICLSAREK